MVNMLRSSMKILKSKKYSRLTDREVEAFESTVLLVF